MEDKIRKLWALVLESQQSELTSDANFFEHGGDSVAAIRLIASAHKYGIFIDVQTVFAHPILSDMASFCSSPERKPTTTGKTASLRTREGFLDSWHLVNKCILQYGVDASAIENIMPCTPFQREMMTTSHQLGCWLSQIVFELGAGSEERARRTFEVLREKTPLFRTSIMQHETDLYQVVLNDTIAWHEECTSLQSYKARDYIKRISYGGPCCRYAIIRDANRTYLVVLSCISKTHAIYDRWSETLLFSGVRECFQKPDTFSKKPNRPLFDKFVDFVTSQDSEGAIAFWLNRLEGLSRYDLLFKPAMNREFLTSNSITRSIENIKPRHKAISFSTVSQVAWALTLAKSAACDDIFYCSVRSGRHIALPEVDEIIGPTMSLIPVRIRIQAEQSLEDLLRTVQDDLITTTQYEPFGIQGLQEYFGHRRYAQSLFVPQLPKPDSFRSSITAEDRSGVKSRLRAAEELNTPIRLSFGLTVALTRKGDDLGVWAPYDETSIARSRVISIVEDFVDMLNYVSTKPWKTTNVTALCPHLAPLSTRGADSVERVIIPDRDVRQEELRNGDSTTKATLAGLFSGIAKDSQAVIIPEGNQPSVSYAQLYDNVMSLQREFAALGIAKDMVVSSALPNSYELVVSFLATSWQGSIVAPLNPGYKQEEFEFYIDDIDVSLILIPKDSYKRRGPVVAAAIKRGTAIAEFYCDGEGTTLDLKEKGKLAGQERQDTTVTQEKDVALVLHTSGTTGTPKAVPLTHRNLMSSIDNICRTYQLTEKDRTILIMPLFHIHGLLASFLAPLRSGGTIILPSRLSPSF